MIILEVITEFIIEVIFIDRIGGAISKVNIAILKLRGIDTRTINEIQLNKLKKRYEAKNVMVKSDCNIIKKGNRGVVLEVVNKENALVEFENLVDVLNVPINKLRLKV